jgi:signal transduction histidine kinase
VSFFRSIRFRLSVQYSALVFGIGGALLSLVYIAVRSWLHNQSMTRYVISGEPVRINNDLVGFVPDLTDHEMFMIETVYNDIVLNEVARFTAFGLAALFLLSLVVGWFMSGRVLKPIDQITRKAQEIEASDLSQRIDLNGPDDELTRLGSTIDSMLERLDRAFGSQRRFLADTSHDLRTPLAVIRSNIEVALDDPETAVEEWRETAGIVNRNVEKMAEMIDGLLAVARAETASSSPAPVNLDHLVTRKARDYQPVVFEAGIHVSAEPGQVGVMGVDLALERALANLVDNAMQVAPVGSTIRIASGSQSGWAYLAVDDAGPGLLLDDEEMPIGLGLSIVERVVVGHGGRLATYPGSSGAGTTMVMWLPLAGCKTPHPNNSPLTVV